MSRRVVNEIRAMPEHHRYLRGLRSWVGFRQTAVRVEREARYARQAEIQRPELLKLAMDGIFSFSIVPLRFLTLLGALTMSVAMGYAGYSLYVRFVEGHSPVGFTALIVAIIFLSGVQLFFMGIIGEYVGRIFEASKARPNYVIAEKFGGGRTALATEDSSRVALRGHSD